MTDGKVISFINMKGGVGKTTLCINVGYTLAKHFNKKTLIIDMDPQFNATQALMEKFRSIEYYEKISKENKTISQIINHNFGGIHSKDDLYGFEDIVDKLDDKNYHLIPGDLNIIDFETSRRGSEKILQAFISENNLKEKYDYILIDSPPTYSIFSIASLIASDYYIVPIAPDVFSALGYELLNRVISNDIVLKDTDVKELGIVFTLINKDKIGRNNVIDSFKDDKIFINMIAEYERIRTGKVETFMLDMSTTEDDIINLTEEILSNIKDDIHEER